MIIFKAFQGLENFYIKFQDFRYFSRICTNPVTFSLILTTHKRFSKWFMLDCTGETTISIMSIYAN